MNDDDLAARFAEAARKQPRDPEAERILTELFEEIALTRAQKIVRDRTA